MRFGYARVSSRDQCVDLQVDALVAAGVDKDRIYIEIETGRKFDRPELLAVTKALRAGDELVVFRLDRIGRSTKHLLSIVDDLAARDIGFVSLHEKIDTTSATGKLMLAVFAAIAAFERDLLVERTQAGLSAARARGRKGGRPQSMKESDIKLAKSMLADDAVSVTEVAKHFNVGRNTLYRAMRRSA